MDLILSQAGFLWLFLFSSLSAFFVVAERRYRGKGFGLLALMLLVVGLWSATDWLRLQLTGGPARLIGFGLVLLLGLVAAALNTHFLAVHFSVAGRKWYVSASYLLLVGAGLLVVGVTSSQLLSLDQFGDDSGGPMPSALLTWGVLGSIAIQLLLGIFVLFPAWKAGRAPARGLLVTLALVSPLALAEGYLLTQAGSRWYLVEGVSWTYTLIIVASLISEFQGTEGLLRQTTSSLAARTAELESSYAEINLMASELARKQQLAAVGELAAAIAHEVRNPLAIIMNAVSAMKRPKISDGDRTTLLGIVNEESERLNQLVAELLRFARPVTAARRPTSLHDICEKASQAAPEGYDLQVQTGLEEQLGPVLVDPGLFRLALDNLISNSCQAMPGGGRIKLTVRQGLFSDGSPAAAVYVRDTGEGMDQTDLAKAKKPFFTTKPRGTGLGIPIAEKIVEAHGGEMEIVSHKGEGTTVSILLPLESELRKAGTYSDGLKSANRRRLRSIPPVASTEDIVPVFEPITDPKENANHDS